MKVWRIPIADHPLLVGARAVLEQLDPPRGPFIPRGDWKTDIEEGPPAEDRPRPHNYHRTPFHPPHPLDLPTGVMLASINYYPPGGAGMGWHTDSIAPGWRIYLARPMLDGNAGCFIHRDGALTIKEYDDRELATAFLITGEKCATWHAVRALWPRMSLGLRIREIDDPAALALGLRP